VGKEDDAAALIKIECELKNREGNGEGAHYVDEDDSGIRDPELEVLREMCKKYKQQKEERKERLLKEGNISRVKAEWCYRYRVTTKFAEGNYTERNCGHKRYR